MTVASTQADIPLPRAAIWRLIIIVSDFVFAIVDFAIVSLVQLYPVKAAPMDSPYDGGHCAASAEADRGGTGEAEH